MSKTMLSKGIIEAHTDQSKRVVFFDMSLGRMPSEYVMLAKKIDGAAYTESCFAFRLKFLINTNRFVVVRKDGSEIYYMDENGDSHSMSGKLPKNVYDLAVEQCNAYLKRVGIKKERKKRMVISKRSKNVEQQLTQNIILCVYNPDLFIGRRKKYQGSGQLALF